MNGRHLISLLRCSGAGLACRRGTFAVEFALVSPLLLLVLLGAYDGSIAIQEKLALQAATRAGIQYGLVRRPVQGDTSSVVATVTAMLPSDWTAAGGTPGYSINAALTCECSVSGAVACDAACPTGQYRLSYLSVEVRRRHRFLFRYPGFGDSIDIADRSLVRLQ
jgi:hypothetical protein